MYGSFARLLKIIKNFRSYIIMQATHLKYEFFFWITSTYLMASVQLRKNKMEKFVKRKVSLPASLKLNIPVKVHLQILIHVPHFLNTPSRMHDCANFGCFLERYIEAIWVRPSLYYWKFCQRIPFLFILMYSQFLIGGACQSAC